MDLAIKVAKVLEGLNLNTLRYIAEKFFRYSQVDTFRDERLKAIDTAIKLSKDELTLLDGGIDAVIDHILGVADTLLEFYTEGEAIKNQHSRYMFEEVSHDTP